MFFFFSYQRFLCLNLFFFLFPNLVFSNNKQRSSKKTTTIKVLNKNKQILVKKLLEAKQTNNEEIYNELNLHKENPGFDLPMRGALKYRNALTFKTLNPYFPRFKESLLPGQTILDLAYGKPEHRWSIGIKKGIISPNRKVTHYSQEQIVSWYSKTKEEYEGTFHEVCAFKFERENEKDYILKTFPTKEEALRKGFSVTHQYKCGTCSSLKDLAIYIAKPDLTSPVRSCVQKPSLMAMKKCLVKKVGFSERCAESWAYNGDNTKLLCKGICIEDYGLINILLSKFEGPNTIIDENGNEILRPCLACDEYKSGPAFKYTAARTRRSSGLISKIPRPENEFYPINHYAYFKFFRDKGEEELEKLMEDFRKTH